MNTTAARQRVLVVEDDAVVRGLLTKHLRRTGFEVAEAADAETVISGAATEYDLVVTDVHLPGKSGVELARELNSSEKNLPVVFVTGDNDASLARTALSEGAAGYLMKPFEFFELDALVRGALRTTGRNLAPAVARMRALELRRHAMLQADRVVVSSGPRATRRPPRIGWKAIATVLGALAFSWYAGAAVGPDTAPSQVTVIGAPAADGATVYVPYMVEQPAAQPRR